MENIVEENHCEILLSVKNGSDSEEMTFSFYFVKNISIPEIKV